MNETTYFKFSNQVIGVPLVFLLLIWGVFWIELKWGLNLNDYGVYPRKWNGLKGVFFSPFIHGSISHLYNNTIPLALLTAGLFYFYRPVALRVLLYGIVLSGFLTWFIGRPSYHIGASGLIYVLASFIFFRGIVTKHYRLVALSMIVVFIYGGMIWFVLPIEEGISWEGHLSGLLTGLFFSFLFKVSPPIDKKYSWEKENYNEEDDEFLKYFDENGNFIEQSQMDKDSEITVKYDYKKGRKD